MPQNVPETQPGMDLGPTKVDAAKAQINVEYPSGGTFGSMMKSSKGKAQKFMSEEMQGKDVKANYE